ncbi:MAG: zinc ribbon domain-containing protein [Thermoplasmata archaeon]
MPAIFGTIGALLLIFGEFGGWYNYEYYYGIREYGSIHAGTIAIVLILPMAILLFFSAFLSIQAYKSDPLVARKLVLRGLIASMIVFIVVLIGGIALLAATWDLDSNWLSEGFYGGFFGGLLSAIFLGYEYRRMTRALGPMPAAQYPPPQPYQPYAPPAQPPQPVQPAPEPAQPRCANCGAVLQPGVRFCQFCGTPQAGS